MRRRDLLGMLGSAVAIRPIAWALSGAVVWPMALRAQSGKRVYRIGYLSAPSRESVQRAVDTFLRKLHELGWVVGDNLIIEYRWADGNIARLPELAAELIRLNVDLIVAPNTAAAVAAHNATKTIPIVMMFVSEPVQLKLVSSLSQPGGNVTGTTFTAGPGFLGKVLEILKQAVPAIKRVGVLGDRADPAGAYHVADLRAAAAALEIELEWFDSSGSDGLGRTFAVLGSHQVDALLVNAGGTLMPHRKRLAELALEQRLPTIGSLREFAEAGVLLSYGVNLGEFASRSAVYVDKILKGAQPANLAIEQPTRYELLVNLHTAKALGISISPAILARADEVIE